MGLAIGVGKADELVKTRSGGLRGAAGNQNIKVMDTSAIINGRIADIFETGFVEGTLIIPQFVLQELLYIADSSDSLRRVRGAKARRMKKDRGSCCETAVVEAHPGVRSFGADTGSALWKIPLNPEKCSVGTAHHPLFGGQCPPYTEKNRRGWLF